MVPPADREEEGLAGGEGEVEDRDAGELGAGALGVEGVVDAAGVGEQGGVAGGVEVEALAADDLGQEDARGVVVEGGDGAGGAEPQGAAAGLAFAVGVEIIGGELDVGEQGAQGGAGEVAAVGDEGRVSSQ